MLLAAGCAGRNVARPAFAYAPGLWRVYDDALKSLPARGVEIFKQEDRREGVFVGRSAYIRDPDGNVIEFIDVKRAPAPQA